jgi:hypothetical protein
MKLVLSAITSGYLPIIVVNSNNDAIEAALENTLSRDGQSPNTMSADIDMNSHKVLNLAAPTNLTDAVRLQDLEEAVFGILPNVIVPGTLTVGTKVITPLIAAPASTTLFLASDNRAGDWAIATGQPDFLPAASNLYDIGRSPNNLIRSGYFGTSVVTPVVDSGAGTLALRAAGGTGWTIPPSTLLLLPGADNNRDIGSPSFRVRSVFTPIIDSGTTGPLSLKTNNGNTGFQVLDGVSNNDTWFTVTPDSTAGGPVLSAISTAANQSIFFNSKGAGALYFRTGGPVAQFQVVHTASANRNITVTGSNGGNPTINTTGGNLAITPSIVAAGNLTVNGPTIFRIRDDGSSATPTTGFQLQNLNSTNGAASPAILFDVGGGGGAKIYTTRGSAAGGTLLFNTDTTGGVSTTAITVDPTQKVTLASSLALSTAASKIIPGVTSISHRNNADTADNLIINDNGDVIVRGTLTGPSITKLSIYVNQYYPTF